MRQRPGGGPSDETLARRAKISKLYLRGKTFREIGAVIGIGSASVCQHMKAIRREWRSSAIANIGEKIDRELASIDQVEAEAWEAYRKSTGLHKIKTEETGVGPQGEVDKKTVRSERLAGDPRFMGIIVDCVKRRCEIMGLNAAKRHELTGLGGGPIKTENGVSISYDNYARAYMDHTRKSLQSKGLGDPEADGAPEPIHPVESDPEAGAVSHPART